MNIKAKITPLLPDEPVFERLFAHIGKMAPAFF